MHNVISLNLKEFSDKRGSLVPLEFPSSLPFPIKRIYYIYNVDKQEYEEYLNELNAQSEEIHQRDQVLELQLRQLDTEQETIVTELESVKKVIDKNIEIVFKTFQS